AASGRETGGLLARDGEIAQVDQEVDDILGAQLRKRKAFCGRGGLHPWQVIPHGFGEREGIVQRLPGGDRWDSGLDWLVDAVALGAAAHGEDAFAAAGVAGTFEKAGGVEVREEIGGGLLVQVARPHGALAHNGPHGRRMIPHRGGEHGGSKITVYESAEVGTRVAAFAIDAVAPYAL